ARFLGLNEARLRPVTGIVAIGVEVACEWPVFLLVGAALFGYYVPDWRDAARTWLHRHRAGELVTVEIIALVVSGTLSLLQPLPSGGGGLEVAFLNGFAGDFGPHQVTVLLLWRFYTAILLTGLGVYALVRSIGYRAAVEVFKIGWGKRREAQ